MAAQGRLFNRVQSLDLYALLNVEPGAEKKVIEKAYKRKFLHCDPEKNPVNFQRLSDALEVLSEEKTRAVYDNLLMVRKTGELRRRELRERLENLTLEILKTEQEEGSKITAAEDKARTAIDKYEKSRLKAKEKAVEKSRKKAKQTMKVKVAENSELKQRKKSKNLAVTRASTPIKFVSGGLLDQERSKDEKQTRDVRMEKGVGDWEKHTKGIGSKLLLDMGFQPGKGLGRNLQGRSTIVTVTASGKGGKERLGIGASKPSRGKNKGKKNKHERDDGDKENNNNYGKEKSLEDMNDMKEALPDENDNNVDPVNCGKKKKKKKKEGKNLVDLDELDNKNVGEDSDRDYQHDELLQRVFSIMRDTPTKIFVKPPLLMRVGSEKTAFTNFGEIAKMLHRQPKHLLQFLFAELGTSGKAQSNQLIIKGSLQNHPTLVFQ